MAQEELILKIPSETNDVSFDGHHEAATNLNLVSQVLKTNQSKTIDDDISRRQTHSRESSGTSNLSVKFTIEREGNGSSSPSVTESVSVCSTPQNLSPNSNLCVSAKPPLGLCNAKVKSKKRRSRKSVESSGQDSGAISGGNSANEDYHQTVLSEDCSVEDEITTMDELSDEGNRLCLCHVNGSESRNPEEANSHVANSRICSGNQHNNSGGLSAHKEKYKNDCDHKGDRGSDVLSNSKTGTLGEDAHVSSSGQNIRTSLHRESTSTVQNGSSPIYSTQENPDVLDGAMSKYYRALSSVVSGSTVGNTKGDKNSHRRNISDTHQPLLTDDGSPSDSSCSEDDAGANSSGYTRRKTRTHRTTFGENLSPRTGAAGDGTNRNNSRDRHSENFTSHVIDIDSQGAALDNEENDHIPGEPWKTFLAFLFLFFAWVATTTSLALTHDRVPYEDDPLPDIFLDNVTYQHWGLDASEIIIMISTWSAFIITIFHKHRCIVLRRIFILVGLHYYYRSMTMFVTVLPRADSEYQCRAASDQVTIYVIAQRVLKLLSGMGLSINGNHVYCGDYIYSGHTMVLIMSYLIIREYSPRRWFVLHYASMVTSIAGVVTLLLARGHYSIDIVIAYWITTRIWWMFHTISNNANLKEVDGHGENENNFFKKMWWWYIFRYFERNVPVYLPREFGWPVPKAFIHSKPVQYVYQKFKRARERRSSTSDANTSRPDSINN